MMPCVSDPYLTNVDGPSVPKGPGDPKHLRKSPYFEKPVSRMGDRQGISMIRATTEVGQEGCREEGPLTWVVGGCQETLLRRGASLEEKVRQMGEGKGVPN